MSNTNVGGLSHSKDDYLHLFMVLYYLQGTWLSHILSFARRKPNKREFPESSMGI